MNAPVVPLSILAGNNRFDASSDGWSLLGKSGADEARIFVGRVRFEQPFATAPVVHLGLAGFDISERDCSRLRVSAVDITPEGFSVQAQTWLGTEVWSIDVSWLALGTA
jgi:hypothetical protein